MGIKKFKKAQIQGVKLFLYLLFTFFSVKICSGQELQGKYKVLDPTFMAGDIGVTYEFKISGKFEYTTYEHLERKTISGGNFSINGDTLILNYQKLKDNIESTAKFIEKEDLPSPDRFFADIQIFNSKGNPQAGVNLLLQTKEKKIIMGFMSDEEGKFPYLAIFDPYIKFLTFSFLAHRELNLRTDSLFGTKTKIKIMMKNSSVTYTNEERILKYLIQNRTLDKLVLKPLNWDRANLIRLEKF